VSEVRSRLEEREMLGEVVLVVRGSAAKARHEMAGDEVELLRREIETLRAQGMRVKEVAALLGEKYSYPKREIYRLALDAGGRDKATS
jgi:16S rRNA C1402 (ribose-2'-O) methylase RsmI